MVIKLYMDHHVPCNYGGVATAWRRCVKTKQKSLATRNYWIARVNQDELYSPKMMIYLPERLSVNALGKLLAESSTRINYESLLAAVSRI